SMARAGAWSRPRLILSLSTSVQLLAIRTRHQQKKTPLLSVAGFLASGCFWFCALEVPATCDGNQKDEDDEQRDGPRKIGIHDGDRAGGPGFSVVFFADFATHGPGACPDVSALSTPHCNFFPAAVVSR
ncbi:MAG: hypothetical protein ACNS61_15735, partial [Candidatus Wenzhouxiangella sp. M2_3B_020]